MSIADASAYAGDLTVAEVWDQLQRHADATLIDVRTRAEWAYVGTCDLAAIDKEPIFVEWQTFPSMNVAPDFIDNLAAVLHERGIGHDAPLFFLCRSGIRSKAAAIAMTAGGFSNCFNVAEGFEGVLDQSRHRSTVGGWKHQGLPWKQT